jgi:alpha-amylase
MFRRRIYVALLTAGLAVALAYGALGSASAAPTGGPFVAKHSLRAPVTDENFCFVMADRFENGSTENDTGGMSGDRLEHGFDDTDKAFYQGGDLKGLLARIDYIQGLGSTSIWLTPSFKNKAVQLEDGPSAGYHGYWVTDFTQIDPHLGTNAELRALVDKAHQRGMKVYFDIITNHTADVIGYREGARTAYVPKTESSEPKITVAAQLTRAVPRLLTLYMACTPCTAAITHAAWDVDIQAAPGTTNEASWSARCLIGRRSSEDCR